MRCFEVAVGRRDDPDVDVHGFRASEPLDLPLLEHAQQLDLDVERQVADLVEKNRRVSASSKRPICLASAPVNAPFSRPNSSLSMSVLGIAAQLMRTMTAAAPRALFVNLRRDELLARPRLAEQQHRRVGGGYLTRLIEGALDGGASSDDDARADPFLDSRRRYRFSARSSSRAREGRNTLGEPERS